MPPHSAGFMTFYFLGYHNRASYFLYQARGELRIMRVG